MTQGSALQAVVMAAGEGRRLRPLTERFPKPVLPIDGRPVVASLLWELAAAGIERAHVVTGHLREQVEELLGNGSAFGLELDYPRQPEPLGSADAVRRALRAGAQPPLLVTAADTLFRAGDLASAAAAWLESRTRGGLGVRLSDDPDKTRVTVREGRLISIGTGDLAAAPLWFLDERLADLLDDVRGPPFELVAAFREALAREMSICALELGPTRDLTHPADVVRENFFYLSERT